MRGLMLLAGLWAVLCAPACVSAEQQMPKESLECLQNVFTGVRDNLLDSVDSYWHMGQFERIIAILRLITELDPSDTQAYDDGAWLMENQLRDDEAEVFLLIGLSNSPDRPDLYEALGLYYYTHERPLESVMYYEQAMVMGASPITWHRLAHSYEQAGYFYESLNIWLDLEAREPENPVPKIQIERMLAGEPPPDVPRFLSRAREERKRDAEAKSSDGK